MGRRTSADMGLFLGTAQMSAAVAAPVIIAMVIWERLDPSEEIDRKGSFPLDSVFAICSFLASFLVSMMLLSSVLTPILEQHPWFMGLRGSPWGLRLLGGLLIGDLLYYVLHRWGFHTRPLWKAHFIHHSIEHLYWYSSTRSSVIQALGITFVFCIGFNLMMLDVRHMQIGLMILGTSSVFSHSNIATRLGAIEWFLVTPAHHRMHHVELEETHDMMFAGVFSFFDRIFGTYVEPTEELLQGPKGQEFDLHSVPRHVLGI